MGTSAVDLERLLQDARLHLAQGELNEAVARATEAIRQDGKEPAAYLVRAEAHRRLKQPERALADLAVAIRLDPKQPGPYVIRAEILKRRNVFDQAIADATHALTLDPRNAAAFSIRAACRSAIGDQDGAKEDVQEMLAIDPTRPIPDLRPRTTNGDGKPGMASDEERFWKAPGQARDDQRTLFADGKPVDKTYRSRSLVDDEDAPEALGTASGYKPETVGRPIPRHRTARRGPQVSPILVGVVVLGLIGGGVVLFNQKGDTKATTPSKLASQPAGLTTAIKGGSESSPSGTASEPAKEAAVQPIVVVTAASTDQPLAGRVEERMHTSPSAKEPIIEGSRRLEGHTKPVMSVAFSPDGKRLASASIDSTVRFWDVGGDDPKVHVVLGSGSPEPAKPFMCLAFSNDGRFLAAGDADGRIFLWDASRMPPKLLHVLKKHIDGVNAIAFSPDNKTLATSDLDDGLIYFWDLADPDVPVKTSISTGNIGVWALAYSPDGKLLFENINRTPQPKGKPAIKSDLPSQIWAWDVSQRPYVKKTTLPKNRDDSWTMACSPDGSRIAFNDGDVVKVVDVTTGKQVTTFEKHTGFVRSVTYTPDGRFVLSGSNDKTARLWDASSGEQILVHDDGDDRVLSVAVSPDGRFAALGRQSSVITLLRLSVSDAKRVETAFVESPKMVQASTRQSQLKAIRWVLKRGGFIDIEVNGKMVRGTASPAIDALLDGEFKLLRISLDRANPTTDDLERLLEQVPDLPKLQIGFSQIGDADLETVAKFADLISLDIPETKVTDAGLKHLAGMRKLTILNLGHNLQLTKEGMANLSRSGSLEFLMIQDCNLDDQSIPYLSRIKTLKAIDVTHDRLSPQGFEKLKKSLPKYGQ